MGYIHAICAYLLWGVFPIFWKQLSSVPLLELVFHRMFWAFLSMWLLLSIRKKWSWIQKIKKNPKYLFLCLLSALMISCNWFLFIWAVSSGYILEASLGYFINPLFFVILGALVFKEKMRPKQILATIIATMGVLYLTFVYGNFPYVALSVATSFALYGLIRKTIPLDTFEGLAVETAILFIPAILYLINLEQIGTSSFFKQDTSVQIYVILTGFVTVAPLLFFASAAQKVPFYALGFFQYIAPTLQFLIGIFLYKETFDTSRLIGFAFVWLALLIFSLEGIIHIRRNILKNRALGSVDI